MVFVTLYSFGTEGLFRNGLCTRANRNFKVPFFWHCHYDSDVSPAFSDKVSCSWDWSEFSFRKADFFLKSYTCLVIVHRTNLFTGIRSLPFLPSVFKGKTGKNWEKYCKQPYWWHLMCQCCMVSKCNSISSFWKISKQMHLMKVWKNVKATKWALTERE